MEDVGAFGIPAPDVADCMGCRALAFRFGMSSICFATLVLMAADAAARPATCYLEVGGQAFIEGPCDFETLDSGDGSFRIMAQSGLYFAYLFVESPGRGVGHWNEEAGANHAHTALGILERDGACWISKTAQICAW